MNTLLFNIRNLVATMLQPVLRTVDGCRCGMVNSKSYNLVVGAYLFFKSRWQLNQIIMSAGRLVGAAGMRPIGSMMILSYPKWDLETVCGFYKRYVAGYGHHLSTSCVRYIYWDMSNNKY